MAKSRKRKIGRPAATGRKQRLLSNGQQREASDDESQLDESLLADLTEQLHAANWQDVQCALARLAGMPDDRLCEAVAHGGLVRSVTPLLMHQNPCVRLAATGALRNMSLVSPDICDSMVAMEVMSPLTALLVSYQGMDWQSVGRTDGVDYQADIFIEAVGLLWNLCEANETALKMVNEHAGLLPVLLVHLEPAKFGEKVVIAVLMCLYSISEDNQVASTVIREQRQSLLACLAPPDNEASVKSVRPSRLHLTVLAHGVMVNCCNEELEEGLLPQTLGVLMDVMQLDHRKLINEYTSLVPMEDDDADLKDEDEASMSLLADVQDTLLAQQTALEILTNLCCDDDASNWGQDEDEEDGDNDDDGDECEEREMMGVEEGNDAAGVSVLLEEAIQSGQLLSKVLHLARMPADNVMQILRTDASGHKDQSMLILKRLSALRCRALLCVSNLVDTIPASLQGVPQLGQVWLELAKMCFNMTENLMDDAEQMDSATAALRAITPKLSSQECELVLRSLSQQDMQAMLHAGVSSPLASVRINVIHVSGGIAAHLLKHNDSQSGLIRMAALFLLEAAAKDEELRVVAESLDQLFDLFADDSTDQLCLEMEVVPKLKRLLPGLKTRIGLLRQRSRRRPRRARDSDMGVIDMAKTNLVRFIRYKEKRPMLVAARHQASVCSS